METVQQAHDREQGEALRERSRPKVTEDGTIICDTPESIDLYRLLAIRGRLKLEIAGIKFRQPTTPAVAAMMGVPRVQRKKALAYVQARIDELTAPIVEDPA